jgi:DNA-binding CsgD family transcriptional regulator
MKCRVATWLGDHDRACRLGERAVQETSEPESWFDTVARATLAQAHLAAGDVSTVEVDLLVAGGGHLLPRFDPATRCDWWEVLTRAALGREDAPDIRSAAHYAELATRTADELPLQSPQAAAALANAHVAAAQERWSVAAAAAMDAADGFAVVGNRLEQGRALLTAGTSYAAGGSRGDGLDVLRLADAAFAECSAAHLQAQTRASMRRLGVRLPRQGRRAPAAELTMDPADDAATQRSLAELSRREQEVADLVRAGRTNRQIAADLVVSEKTVESHLSHIFTKLGVGSRAAVASAVERNRAGPRRPAP